MRSYFRTLRFRLGLATPASITSPLKRMTDDLLAFINHSNDEAAAINAQIIALRDRKGSIYEAVAQANEARSRISQLLPASTF